MHYQTSMYLLLYLLPAFFPPVNNFYIYRSYQLLHLLHLEFKIGFSCRYDCKNWKFGDMHRILNMTIATICVFIISYGYTFASGWFSFYQKIFSWSYSVSPEKFLLSLRPTFTCFKNNFFSQKFALILRPLNFVDLGIDSFLSFSDIIFFLSKTSCFPQAHSWARCK